MNKKMIGSITLSSMVALAASGAHAAETSFSAEKLESGYQLAAAEKDAEAKCGEGKCGEGACGAKSKDSDKDDKPARDANKDKSAKDREGKCGEGKCGLDRVDTDKDGRVSKAEFAAIHPGEDEKFAAMDTNGDGYVDQAEHEAHKAAAGKADMEGKCGEGRCGGMA